MSRSVLSQVGDKTQLEQLDQELSKISVLQQCPQCNKKALEYSPLERKYECIWCDFSRDKSRKPRQMGSTSDFSFLVLIFIVTVVVVVMLNPA